MTPAEPTKLIEIAVLSDMLSNVGVYTALCVYTDDLFDNTQLGHWFTAIKKSYETKGNCDLATVIASLKESGHDGAIHWLGQITEYVSSYGHADEHVSAIIRAYRKRVIDRASQRAIDAASADESISVLEQGIDECSIGCKQGGYLVEQIATEGLESVLDTTHLIRTDFAPIDELYGGFGKGELVVIGGHAKSGKTTLALQIGIEMSKYVRVNMYSLEMTRNEMFRKLISTQAEIPVDMIKKSADVLTQNRIAKAIEHYKSGKYKFKIVDDMSNLQEILAHARLSSMRDGMQVMIVDYLQLCDTDHKQHDKRYAIVGSITRDLKRFAQQTGCTVIALSQLTGDENERPGGQNFRESGNIFMDANIPLLVWNDKKNAKTLLIGERSRRAPQRDYELTFSGAYSKFEYKSPIMVEGF